MKLLLLAPFPYGTQSGQGGATVSFNALKAMSESHEVHVLCFSANSKSDVAAIEEMRPLAKSVQTVPLRINKWRVLMAKLRGALTQTPEQAIYFESPQYRDCLSAALVRIAPDIVITQFPQMAQYLPACQGYATVHDVQDAFSVSGYRRVSTAPSGWKRRYAKKQWQNWIAYESRYYPQARQCWTLSEQDQYGLTVFTPGMNVLCMGLPLADLERPAPPPGNNKVGFIASFGHMPNVEAVAYLMRDIAPFVLAEAPAVEFLIAGRNPPDSLTKSAPPNVKFVGYVDSLSDFYAKCDVVIAPLLSGGGVKIKVAEALCHGKAVVTTPIGAEGIPIVDKVHALIERDPVSFAQAICRLIAFADLRATLSTSGHALAEQTFATARWTDRVNQQLLHLAELARDANRHAR